MTMNLSIVIVIEETIDQDAGITVKLTTTPAWPDARMLRLIMTESAEGVTVL